MRDDTHEKHSTGTPTDAVMSRTTHFTGDATRTHSPCRFVQLCALLIVCLPCLVTLALGSRAASSSNASATTTRPVAGDDSFTDESQQATGDFSKFSHVNPQHSRLPCLLCHRRDTNAVVPVRSLGHSPCIGCHVQQFNDPQSNICAICHTGVSASNPPLKPFPGLRSFNVRFDHATHARNSASCATCHKPAGRGAVALSIPASASAHATCFQCHTPRAQAAGRDISSCDTCHQIGSFARTPAWSLAYSSTPFSHAAHTRKGLSCAECHTLRAGASQSRQVSAPVPLQHHAPAGTRSCASCHDNRRAFGGDDFNDCTRCHQGKAWHF
jgi:c(7)-type cytochrome triheme protein